MFTKLWLTCFFIVSSVVWCSENKIIVFTGEILKIQPQNFIVRVHKLLLSDDSFPSIVRLRKVHGGSLRKKTKTLYIFFVVPRKRSKGFNLTHYWTIKQRDYKDFQSGNLKEIQQHFHHRFRRSVDVCNQGMKCMFGGKCGVLITGKPTCNCPITCGFQDEPVCGTDRVTYPNLCTVQRHSCLKQRHIDVQYYGPCMVSSCKQALQEELGNKDGEYSFQLSPQCQRPIEVYCHGMNTSSPEEYLTLAPNRDNHARIYDKKLQRSLRNQCGGINPGSEPYEHGGYTKFFKVRFNVNEGRIIPDDFQFTMSEGKRIPYGTAGDCYSSNRGNCRKGSFSIDLTGTGLRLQSSVSWSVVTRPRGIRIQDFEKKNRNQVVSGKCGGNCGLCQPKGKLLIEQLSCDPCNDVKCRRYSTCESYPLSSQGYRCVCPTCVSSQLSVSDGKVCGSDGKTYESKCLLQKNACEKQKLIQITHKGGCDPCEKVACEYHGKCIKDLTKLKRYRCICKDCTSELNTVIVCGSDKKTYQNMCQLKRESCQKRSLITVNHVGTCNPCKNVKCQHHGVCEPDPKTMLGYRCVCRECPPEISKVCGSDKKTYLSECVLQRASCQKTKPITVLHKGSCNPCENKKCSFNAICVKGSDNKAKCMCTQCSQIVEYVCASDGKTYPNECETRRKSCMARVNIKVIHKGRCDPCNDVKCRRYSTCESYPLSSQGYRCVCLTCVSSQLSVNDGKVCGSDGKTYESKCLLQKNACEKQKLIQITHKGGCEPCKDKDCHFNSVCVVDSDYQASCQCTKCQPTIKHVCGSDERTYLNECELRQRSCVNKSNIIVAHRGKCDPCKDKDCHFNSVCVVDSDYQASCQCTKCQPTIKHVCGSDERTYLNECELRQRSCVNKSNIIVAHHGKCEPCKDKDCHFNSVCVVDSDYQASCQCTKCHLTIKHVCGSDEKTYLNECELRRWSCLTKNNIRVAHDGKCDPCKDKDCRFNSVCVVDQDYQAICKCPKCSPTKKHVCGSDGKTYLNECELRQRSCMKKTNTKVLHNGKCNPCEKKRCSYNGTCVVGKDYQADCKCPECPKLIDYVCGSDGKSYSTPCHAKQIACRTQTHIEVVKNGKCNECNCPPYAQCQRDLTSSKKYKCICPLSTLTDQTKVCGSDGITYTNKYVLKRYSCLTDIEVNILYPGICKPCQNTVCANYAICIATPTNQGVCRCINKCFEKKSPVCGNDGKTYKNKCELKRASCRQQRPIKVEKSGRCDTCNCPPYAQCQRDLTSSKKYKCVCPSSTLTDQTKVCGSDGITYTNKYVLKRYSCLTDIEVNILYPGICKPCKNILCVNHAICIATATSQGICRCPKQCFEKKDPVCASDGKTYENECELKRTSCSKQQPLKIKNKGPCDKCDCPPYAKCQRDPTSPKGHKCICPLSKLADRVEVCGSDGRTYNNKYFLMKYSCLTKILIKISYPGVCKPCQNTVCANYAICIATPTNQGVCRCINKCFEKKSPVCGNDGKTYQNKCELKRASCRQQRPIKVEKSGRCDICNCPPYAQCQRDLTSSKKYKCICPSSTLTDQTKVCGSDGITYTNKYVLKRYSCLTDIEVNILYPGICKPCKNILCVNHAICIATSTSQGICRCPKQCFEKKDPVCASDGKTYENECELKRTSCSKQQPLKIKNKGPCDVCNCPPYAQCQRDLTSSKKYKCICPSSTLTDQTKVCGSDGITYTNKYVLKRYSCLTDIEVNIIYPGICKPCRRVICKNNAICVATKENQGICRCPQTCYDKKAPVCGSDGKVYESECEMKKVSCKKQQPLTVVKKGPCNVCYKNRCNFYAKCKPISKKSYTCVCPRKVSTFTSKVCGSDGRTYVNEHVLRQDACLKHVDITIAYKGVCRPCRTVSCKFNAECVSTSQGRAVCKCPKLCFSVPKPVCGSDEETYKDLCELRRTSCIKQQSIKVIKQGVCLKIPEDVDIIYALGSNGENAKALFDLEKNITKAIIGQQNFPGTKHGVIVFENQAKEQTSLHDFPNKQKLITLVETLKWSSDATRLDKPLLKASEMFKDQARIGSRKFLIIFVTGNLDTPNDDLQRAAKKVVDSGGKIIAYKMGDHLKDEILKNVVPKDNIITVRFTDDPWRLAIWFNLLSRKDPCEIINCKHHAVCRVQANDHVRCECPTCTKSKDPVCASDGKTYTNECELKRFSCKAQLPLNIKFKGKCVEKENVVFVLGSSGPKARQVFEHEKEIVKEFINNKTTHGMKYTIVTYSKEISKSTPINEYNKVKREKLIDTITWPKTGTRLDLGLEKARNVLKNNKDPKVLKIVYVFVNSEAANVASNDVKEAAKKLKDYGSDIITININDGININENKYMIPKSLFAVKTKIFDDPKKLAILLSYRIDPCGKMNCNQHHGTCVLSINNKPECKCLNFCNYQDSAVCGEDKNTYFSTCELLQNVCVEKIPNAVSHVGQCKHCDILRCPPYSKCMLRNSGEPFCLCRDLTKCPREQKIVCGSDKKIYKNLCVLKAESCRRNKTILVMEEKECVARSFSGNSYMKIKMPKNLVGERTKLIFDIRPVKKNGVLFYADSKDSRDFLALALKNGRVIYRHDAGSGPVELKSDQLLKMNKWYSVMIKRQGNKAELVINNKNIKVAQSKEENTVLNIDDGIYLGGMDSLTTRLEKNLGMNDGYHGCLKNLIVNGQRYDIMLPGKHVERQKNIKHCIDNPCKDQPCKNGGKCQFLGETYKCLCPDGFVGKRCQAKERGVFLKGNDAFIAISAVKGKWKFALSMEIRPKKRNGLIFYASARNSGEDCLILDMNDGLLELRLNVGTGLNIFRTRKRLALHVWHKIQITRNSHDVYLVVDDEAILMTKNPDSLRVRLEGNMVFGAPYNALDRIIIRSNTDFEELSYTGCIRNVIFTNYVLDLNFPGQDVTALSNVETCSSCVGLPCGSNGHCLSQPDMTFRCNCFENFVTDLCEFREKPLHFRGMDSFITLPLLKGRDDFEISLEIKPENKNVLILYMNGKSNKDHLAIALLEGILQLRISAGSGQSVAKLDKLLMLSTWHKIDVVRKGRSVTMSVNGANSATAVISGKLSNLDLRGKMIIGDPSTPVGRIIARDHVPLRYLEFTGCFRRMYVNQRRYNLAFPNGDILQQNNITDC